MPSPKGLISLDEPCRAFARRLQESHLLSEGKLGAAMEQLHAGRGDSHPVTVASWMIEQGYVTRWQAEQLLGGRTAFWLGKYKLIEKIGSGGMGAVYKAEQAGIRRIVALKLMEQELLQKPGSIDRFMREIQAVARLQHSNIVAAYDADQVAGRYFLILEYVEGQDLEAILQQVGRLSAPVACEIILQAAAGLQHAFERGIVHRDIKPGNLLITRGSDDRMLVKILDMGLARFIRERENASLTKTGQIMGTPDYMAPEQVEDTSKVDIRADIYGLGASLFEMLVGRPPFHGGSATIRLMARLAAEAPRLNSVDPSIPQELDEIVAAMLAKKPADRYATPAEVVAAISPFAQAEAIELDGSFEESERPESARTANLSAQSLVQLASVSDPTITSVALQAAVDHSLDDLGHLLRNIEVDVKRGAELVRREAAEARGWRSRAVAFVGVAIVGLFGYAWHAMGAATLTIEWAANERGGSLEIDNQWMPAPEHGKVSVASRPGRRKLRLTRPGYETIDTEVELKRGEHKSYHPEWKPLPETQRKLAWESLEKEATTIRHLEPLNPKITDFWNRVLQEKARQMGSPEATRAMTILQQLANPLDLLDPSTILPNAFSIARPGADAHVVGVYGIEFAKFRFWRRLASVSYSRDGTMFAAVAPGSVRVFDASSQSLLWSQTLAGLTHCFSPDGRRIAIFGYTDALVLDAHTGDSIGTFEIPSVVFDVKYSPDGSRIVAGGADGFLAIWKSEPSKDNQKPIVVFPRQATSLVCTEFSPDGQSVFAVYADDPTIRQWDANTGKFVRELKGHDAPVRDIDISVERGQLASASLDKTIRLWDVAAGAPVLTLKDPDGEQNAVAFAANHNQLFSTGRNGRISCWDIDSGKIAHSVLASQTSIIALAPSPNGKFLATGGDDGRCLHWYIRKNRLVLRDPEHSRPIHGVAASGDCRRIAAAAVDGVLVWDVPKTEPRLLPIPNARIADIAFAPYGDILASATFNRRVVLWDTATGWEIRTLDGHQDTVRAVAFSPNGKLLASGGDDDRILIWDVSSGDLVHDLKCIDSIIRVIAWHPDGKRIAVAYQNSEVQTWNIEREEKVFARTFTGSNIRSLSFSDDGRRLVFPAHFVVQRWDLFSGKEEPPLTQTTPVSATAFDPSATRFTYATGDGNMQVFDLTKNTTVDRWRILPGWSNADEIYSSADGRYLITYNPNGSAYVLRRVPRSRAR